MQCVMVCDIYIQDVGHLWAIVRICPYNKILASRTLVLASYLAFISGIPLTNSSLSGLALLAFRNLWL